jgi:DNA-binding XRE family transcriptional regulator
MISVHPRVRITFDYCPLFALKMQDIHALNACEHEMRAQYT